MKDGNAESDKVILNQSAKLIKKNSKKVLIYCADITGHRHLYSSYIIRFYLEHNCDIYFYYAGRIIKYLPSGSIKYQQSESLYLDPYKDKKGIHFRNICDSLNQTNNEIKVITEIQAEIKPDISFFIDGDILKLTFWW